MKEAIEFAGAIVGAVMVAVVGGVMIAIICAAPFVAIGSGLALGIKVVQWAFGW